MIGPVPRCGPYALRHGEVSNRLNRNRGYSYSTFTLTPMRYMTHSARRSTACRNAQRGARPGTLCALIRRSVCESTHRSMSLSLCIGMLLFAALETSLPAQTTGAAASPIAVLTTETPVSFDVRGRITVLTPRTVGLSLQGLTWWPAPENTWREARLYLLGNSAADSASAGMHVLALVGANGAITRYSISSPNLDSLRARFSGGHTGETGTALAADVELSQPAGYTFVRNQTFLGLAAYGPATAAILSEHGGASATGGYFLAAGGSFFVAAQMIRTRVVTRSQTILGTHAGFRGGAAGAAIAAIADAHGGPGYGTPILLGALGGTVGGFLAAKHMSDGEAASSGLGADMFAVTTLGVAAAADAFRDDSTKASRNVALGAAVGMAAVGYVVGPRYAKRSSYNVTAGDASIALATALIGAAAGAAVRDLSNSDHVQSAAAFTTVGLLGGFLVGDRYLVRTHDRTSADAGWARLGALAGALMGGGVAVISNGESQATLGLIAGGAALGLVAADRMIAPARDAGPMRGVLRTSQVKDASSLQNRVQFSWPTVATAFVLWNGRRQATRSYDATARVNGPLLNLPAGRFVF